MEPLVIRSGLLPLIRTLDGACAKRLSVDIYHQLHFMAFDVIGEVAFGQSFNMLEHGEHEMVEWIASLLGYSMLRNALPILHHYEPRFIKNLKKVTLLNFILGNQYAYIYLCM